MDGGRKGILEIRDKRVKRHSVFFVLFYFHDLVFDGRARQSVPDEMITHLLLGVCAAQRGPGGRGTIDERGGNLGRSRTAS